MIDNDHHVAMRTNARPCCKLLWSHSKKFYSLEQSFKNVDRERMMTVKQDKSAGRLAASGKRLQAAIIGYEKAYCLPFLIDKLFSPLD